MLSKNDFIKELGKGICIYPFNENNIKENSINLTASKYAWVMRDGYISHDKNITNFSKVSKSGYHGFKKGDCAVKKIIGLEDQIILLPHSTTIIETLEVISVANYLGGTCHSKVGIVALGIGHIGTMIGPNFNGHLAVMLHNISDEVITLPLTETIISITFYKLERPINMPNPTISGHVEKFGGLGISLNKDEERELCKDWKYNSSSIREKMHEESTFKSFQKKNKKKFFSKIKAYINWSNLLLLLSSLILLIILYYIAKYFKWLDTYYQALITACIFPFVLGIVQKIKKRH